MSFIPVKCLECGGTTTRKSNTDPRIQCVDCDAEYRMVRVKCLR